jgi:hypothetical protein
MSAAKTAAMGTAAGTFARLAAARKDGGLQAGEMARRAKPTMMRKRKKRERQTRKRAMMVGRLLALGAAVGAAGALVARRRRRTLWTEYDATQSPSVRPPQAPTQMSEPASSGSQSPGPLAEQARGTLGAPADAPVEADVVSANERRRNIRS